MTTLPVALHVIRDILTRV